MLFNSPERDLIREGVRCVQKGSPCRFVLRSVTGVQSSSACKCSLPFALLPLLQKTSFSALRGGGAGNVQTDEQWLSVFAVWAQVWPSRLGR